MPVAKTTARTLATDSRSSHISSAILVEFHFNCSVSAPMDSKSSHTGRASPDNDRSEPTRHPSDPATSRARRRPKQALSATVLLLEIGSAASSRRRDHGGEATIVTAAAVCGSRGRENGDGSYVPTTAGRCPTPQLASSMSASSFTTPCSSPFSAPAPITSTTTSPPPPTSAATVTAAVFFPATSAVCLLS